MSRRIGQISGKTKSNFEGRSEPRLHGYMVSLVPACPNPDETLFGV
jgi:hypothetical protein